MKKQEPHVEQEIEQTLQAFEGMERAQTESSFYDRLNRRMNRPGRVKWGSRRIRYAAAALVLLILANLISILHYRETSVVDSEDREQYMEAFTEEFFITIDPLYQTNYEE